MFRQISSFLVGFVASEEGVKKQAILPVAWVGAVLMAGAVVLGMPEKAHADTCWLDPCGGKHPYFCKDICFRGCEEATAWWCRPFPGTLERRCFCSN